MLFSITAFHLAAWLALVIVAVLLLLILFEPGLDYRASAPDVPLDSHQFLGLVAAVVDAQWLGKSRVAVLTDGRQFYEAELEAICAARHSIHVEAYVFRPGHVAERFLDALTERARAGDVARLSLMRFLAPVFGLWLAAALFGERIGRVEVAGVVLAVAGTAVVAWEATLEARLVHGTEWSFFGMHFVWWFIWIAIILGAFTTYTPIPRNQLKTGELALDILRRRYAAGQITTEEYERRKVVLERDEPDSASTKSAHQHY